jgi:acetyl esterase/lipase
VQGMKPALILLSLAAAVVAVVGVSASRSRAGPISFSDLLGRARPVADHRIAYGPGPLEFGELWLPARPGPHRVVVLIHGGCWLADLPGLELMTYAAEDLKRRGFAVWNIEYRRLGHAGGGYPGTFQDVAHGVDYLRTLAPTYRLDLHHVVLVGHSAGGHLALWDAARPRLARTSALASGQPLPVAGVVTLAGINDLEAYRASGPDACGGPPTVDQLVGAGHRGSARLYSDTSPAALLPIGVRQAIISGDLDSIVPAAFGRDYAAKARAAGDTADGVDIAGAGHFELIDPRSAAWRSIVPVIDRLSR